MIKKQGGKYSVYSEDGSKRLGGPYDSKEEATKRLREIEYFKHAKNSDDEDEDFELLTFNVGGDGAKWRYEMLEDQQHIVAPMVMMTEGVHKGSEGWVYYPKKEMKRDVPAWNHRPMVLYHPKDSACTPEVLNNRKFGLVLNARYDEKEGIGRWPAEAWINVRRAEKLDPSIIKNIKAGKATEVSTGIYVKKEYDEGNWNGESYEAVARNIRPDHLAVLPSGKGACSTADGAGLLVNDDGERVYPLTNAKKSHQIIQEAVRKKLYASNTPSKGGGSGWVAKGSSWLMDVFDDFYVYQDHDGTLYKQPYSHDHDKEGADAITHTGKREKVKKETEYRKVGDGSYVGNAAFYSKKGSKKMNREKVIGSLIANHGWTEEDREFLEELDDKHLARLEEIAKESGSVKGDANKGANKKRWDTEENEETDQEEEEENNRGKKKKVKNAKNAKKKPGKGESDPYEEEEDDPNKKGSHGRTDNEDFSEMDPEEYLENADMPEAIRSVLRNNYHAAETEKARLIEVIVANKEGGFTKEELSDYDVLQLQKMAKMATPPQTRRTNYAGAGAPLGGNPPVTNANKPKPLGLPKLTFNSVRNGAQNTPAGK